MSRFSENLRQIRKSSGLSMGEVAEQIGTSLTQIARWERGDTSPSLDNALRLAKAFNTSLDELCGIKSQSHDVLDVSKLSPQQKQALKVIVEGMEGE